jgi:hypothetical protein
MSLSEAANRHESPTAISVASASDPDRAMVVFLEFAEVCARLRELQKYLLSLIPHLLPSSRQAMVQTEIRSIASVISVPMPVGQDNRAGAANTHIVTPAQVQRPVYLAYSLHGHQTARSRWFIRLARRCFPNAAVISACEQFSSNVDWLLRWPEILPTVAAVCVFPDADGWVGRGVWDELCDALAYGVPVFVLTNTRLHTWSDVTLIESGRDWRRYARLHLASDATGTSHA